MTEPKADYVVKRSEPKSFYFVVCAHTLAPFTHVKHSCIRDAYAELLKLVREYGTELIIVQTMVRAHPKTIVGKVEDARPVKPQEKPETAEQWYKMVESYMIENGFIHDELRDVWEKHF